MTLRKSLGMFANVRPVRSYAPYVASPHPDMDLVIIRENEEDTYAGIEHRQTTEVTQTLKLITRPGSEAIVRYAFEYARAQGRSRVTCMTKDNIMKLTDGLFHRVFDEIAAEYPEIEAEHRIIDIGAALVGARPDMFDVIVAPNLYGDIISDIAAEASGSVGLAGSSNVGTDIAMFEAVHGSAPDIAASSTEPPPAACALAAIAASSHAGRGPLRGSRYGRFRCTGPADHWPTPRAASTASAATTRRVTVASEVPSGSLFSGTARSAA